MRLGVSQRQRAAPRPAEDQPALDAEMLAQAFDVFNEMPRGVLFKTGVWGALPGAALIEEHDSVGSWIEELAVFRNESATRPTVKKHNRLSVWFSALLVIKLVNRGDP